MIKTFESAITEKKAIGNAYNLTYSESITWQYLCETILEVTGGKVKVTKINYNEKKLSPREFFPFRDVMFLCSNEKLKKDGLHVPEINLEDGMKRAFKWYTDKRPKLSDSKMTEIDKVLIS